MRCLVEKQFTQQVLMISHTTSKKCSNTELSDQKNEDGEFRPLKITLTSRSLLNMVAFFMYKVLRCFYVSLFFYFLPFSAIIMSTLIPLMYRAKFGSLPYCAALN